MIRIILSGCNGKMGQVITKLVDKRDDCEIVAGVDIDNIMLSTYPVFSAFKDINTPADVIIDFSHPSALNSIISFVSDTKIPLVLATTGYTDLQVKQINELAKTAPVFFSFNMSLGMNLLFDLAK